MLATIIFKLWIVEAHLNKVEYKEVEEANELEGRSLPGMRHQWDWKLQPVKKRNKKTRKERGYNHRVGYLNNWFWSIDISGVDIYNHGLGWMRC